MSIAQELRTVGQGLDSLGVEDFDLEGESGGYFALGIPELSAVPERKVNLQRLAEKLRRGFSGEHRSDRKLAEVGPQVLRILFTPEGILRLEAAGIAKRNPVSAGIPNFTKLAQALRMIGEYLEAKSARLLKVRKRGGRISFEYATAGERRASEQWKLAKLYNRWVEISKQRREQSGLAQRRLADAVAAREIGWRG
jgi:hypothetical protein